MKWNMRFSRIRIVYRIKYRLEHRIKYGIKHTTTSAADLSAAADASPAAACAVSVASLARCIPSHRPPLPLPPAPFPSAAFPPAAASPATIHPPAADNSSYRPVSQRLRRRGHITQRRLSRAGRSRGQVWAICRRPRGRRSPRKLGRRGGRRNLANKAWPGLAAVTPPKFEAGGARQCCCVLGGPVAKQGRLLVVRGVVRRPASREGAAVGGTWPTRCGRAGRPRRRRKSRPEGRRRYCARQEVPWPSRGDLWPQGRSTGGPARRRSRRRRGCDGAAAVAEGRKRLASPWENGTMSGHDTRRRHFIFRSHVETPY